MGLCLTTLKHTDKVDCSAPIGPLHPASQIGHIKDGVIWLKVNGVIKQTANLNQMIWNVAEQISPLSEAFELMPGGIIYSGTPENVGPVVRGDVIGCHIDKLPNLSLKITGGSATCCSGCKHDKCNVAVIFSVCACACVGATTGL